MSTKVLIQNQGPNKVKVSFKSGSGVAEVIRPQAILNPEQSYEITVNYPDQKVLIEEIPSQ